ncbi:MAG: hypothetical protein PF541_01595 [Prolixibacteraceae bacterium]|nr:hypothetical protein [Prolixibacteraceae bacterium]
MSKFKNILNYSWLYVFFCSLVLLNTSCGYIWNQIDVWIGKSISHEKLPLINEGDTLIYESSVHVDSFYVNRSKFYDRGEGENKLDYERYSGSMELMNCTDSSYRFNPNITPSEYRVYVYGPGKYEAWNYRITDNDDSYHGIERTVGQYLVGELFKAPNNKVDSISGKEVKVLYYSKDYSVVEYELTNGEVFTLSEESLEMLMERENE